MIKQKINLIFKAPIKGLFIYIFIFLLIGSLSAGEQELNPKSSPCNTDMIKKASKEGLRSLSFGQRITLHRDLKKCPNKQIRNAIKKTNNEKQFKEDAEKSKRFTGWTSGCAYCAVALVVYLALV
ncbi:MAG: hypothetical protein HOD91_06720 [Candidatus Marinimicrobia bacterium]|jgi:hypothetical protein|nr:hypothetical protein [Candidatus Neomarinimicrobiota bacterium]